MVWYGMDVMDGTKATSIINARDDQDAAYTATAFFILGLLYSIFSIRVMVLSGRVR